MANCKSCGAEIEWARHAKTGKMWPLDVTRDSRGNQIETPGGNLAVMAGLVKTYEPADKKLARDRRTSHFATCPHAGQWRNQ